MKIALLMIPSEEVLYQGVLSILPTTLGLITAYIRGKGYDVRQYDLNTDLQDHYLNGSLTREDMKVFFDKEAVFNYLNGGENPGITRFIEKLLAGKAIDSVDAVGISSGGTFYWMGIHLGFLMAYYIKKKYGIPVVMGGNNMIYLTTFGNKFDQLWQAVFKTIDLVIAGPGLESFRKILERLENNPNWTPSPNERQQIKGLIYMEHGEVACVSQDRNIPVKPDFKGLRLDYYMSFLKNPEKAPDPRQAERENLQLLYKWPQLLIQLSDQVNRKRAEKKKDLFIKKLTIPYISHYHCPFNCAFCAESIEDGHVVIADPVRAVDEIEELINEYDSPYFKFYNNYFNMSKKFALAFFEEVKKRKLKFYWSDCARVTGLDLDFLQKMKKSGCMTLYIGLESASKKILKMIDKKIDVKKVEEVLNFCQKVGIWANLETIVGFPNETLEDFRDTVRFLKKNAAKINYFVDNRYWVIPFSRMGRDPEKYGMELEKEIVTYDLLLKGNLRWFLSGKGIEAQPNSFHMYPYNEIGGRRHDEIFKEGLRRQKYLQKFKNKEFTEVRQMLLFMDSVSK
jgi:radical SAM superfamily enzyme YgiQ (UPF0313 family)